MSTSPFCLPATDVHLLRASAIDQEFGVWVARPVPGARPMPAAPPRVLYVLDANLMFGTAVEMTRLMHQLFAELPPLLVVGIAYPDGDLRTVGELRNRDFTPSADPMYEELARRIPDFEPVLPADERMGHARRFLGFLTDEVRPFIAARYDVAAKESILFGSSLGGLFTVWTLLTQPDAFASYIAASPALWWNDRELFRLEEQRASRADDLAARVFVGVGSEEEATGAPWAERLRMVTNLTHMTASLWGRGYPSLQLQEQVFDHETHTSVVPAVLTRGLRSIFSRQLG
ncbi:MAG: alpha/beta hydrolase-fold protein [Planctomycetota bacterium]